MDYENVKIDDPVLICKLMIFSDIESEMDSDSIDQIPNRKIYIPAESGNYTDLFQFLSKSDIIEIFKYFIQKISEKLKFYVEEQVYNPYDAFVKLVNILSKEKLCSNFFWWINVESFNFNDVMEILRIAKKFKSPHIFYMNCSGEIYVPLVAPFMKNLNRREQRKILTKISKILCRDIDTNNMIYEKNNDVCFSFYYKNWYENFHDFSEITSFHIKKFRAILNEHFETKDSFKNMRILKLPYLE